MIIKKNDCQHLIPKLEKSLKNQQLRVYKKTQSIPWSTLTTASKAGNQSQDKAIQLPYTRTWQL